MNESFDTAPGGETLQALLAIAAHYGIPADTARVAESLSGDIGAPRDLAIAACERLGLAVTPIEAGQAASTALPALVVGASGHALVALARDATGFDCQLPGIAGVSRLSAAEIDARCPAATWLAVRPMLHADRRSLLYALPEARRWFHDVFRRHRWILGWALVGTVALNLFGALLPFFSMAVYDRVVPNNALASLQVLVVAAIALVTMECTMRMLRGRLVESAARRMDIALSAAIFDRCLRLRPASRPASGGVLANVVRDFESVREFFASTTLTVLGDLPFALLFLLTIALVGGWLVLVPLAAAPIVIAIAFAVQRPLARVVERSARHGAERTAHLFETMNGLDTVKALAAEPWSRAKWERLTVAIAGHSLQTRETVNHVGHASAAVLAAVNVALVAIGAWMIGERLLTTGQLIAVTMLASRALAPVGQLASLIVRWQQTRLAMSAIDQVMGAPADETRVALQAPALSGRIEFREVSFAYPQMPPLIERLQLQVRPGERIGFIGRLGSGKSTVLKLLLDLYAPQSGAVLVDGLVTTQLDAGRLRRQLGYVPQDVTLFHGSVRENIKLGRTAGGDAALLAAIQAAGLDEIVAQLPAGIATQVGERGERLSGGQRQAVAIARALLGRPPILLLDEPSSMMDPASEQKLIQRLKALEGTTILLVTHRMAMLPLVDRLVVMDRGRAVADGPRDEVLRTLAGPGSAAGAALPPGPRPQPTREGVR